MTLEEIPQLEKLTKAEKLQLVGDLWDSIAAMPDDLPVSEEEKRLLEERFRAHTEAPETSLTLDEFKKGLEKPR